MLEGEGGGKETLGSRWVSPGIRGEEGGEEVLGDQWWLAGRQALLGWDAIARSAAPCALPPSLEVYC